MYKILIVDDENLVRVAFRNMVDYEKYGFYVAGTASDGIEALKMAEKINPDLIITDIRMPNMDGITLIERLNENHFTGQIVMVSNYDDFELVRSGLQLGAIDYLLKLTVTTEEYLKMLEKVKTKLDEESSRQRRQEDMKRDLEKLRSHANADLWKQLLQPHANTTSFPYMKKILFDRPVRLFMLLVLDQGRQFEPGDPEEEQMLNYALLNISQEILGTNEVGQRGQGTFFAVKRNPGTGSGWDEAKKLAMTLDKYLNVQAVAAFAENVDTPEQFHRLGLAFEVIRNSLYYDHTDSVFCLEQKLPEPTRWNLDNQNIVQQVSKLILDEIFPENGSSLVKKWMEQCRAGNVLISDVAWQWALILGETSHKCNVKIMAAEMDHIRAGLQGAACSTETENIIMEGISCINEKYRAQSGKNYPAEIELIVSHIHKHLNRKLSLADLAGLINYNESYMCTVFKEHLGVSIITYINSQKMSHAAEDIIHTDDLIKNIASDYGFNDQFYFNKMFRRHYGLSPSEYRRKYKGNTNSNK